MSKHPLMIQLTEKQVQMVSLAHQYDGIKKLFDGAALQGNGQECDDLRFKLHTLLDAQLDLVGETMMLTRLWLSEQQPGEGDG